MTRTMLGPPVEMTISWLNPKTEKRTSPIHGRGLFARAIDYAMIDGDPNERMTCDCGAAACRKVITGDDWRLPELRRRYAGYFSRFLEERIRAEGA